jgi:hypothetical protein
MRRLPLRRGRSLHFESLEARLTPATLTVTSFDDVVNPDDDATAFTLREAVQQANASPGDDTIEFDVPVAETPPVITLTQGELSLTDTTGVTTISGPTDTFLTIDGDLASRILQIAPSVQATISSVTLSNGFADPQVDGRGGAILNAGHLTLAKVIVSGNLAGVSGQGGGLFNDGGEVELLDSTIFGNTAGTGGGMVNASGSVTLTRSFVLSNSAQLDGGGIWNSEDGSLVINDSSVSANTAGSRGGGIFGHGTIDQSLLAVNSARNGGGVYAMLATRISNSTLSSNLAFDDGGAVFNADHVSLDGCLLVNCTVVQNFAEVDGDAVGTGGGIYTDAFGSAAQTLLRNTIVAGNVLNDGSLASDLAGANVQGDRNNLIGDPETAGGLVHGTNGNIVGQDDGQGGRELLPLAQILDPILSDNGGLHLSHALLPTSVAIDAGDNSALETGMVVDQRGEPRIVDGPDADATATVDIGAVEFSAAVTAAIELFPSATVLENQQGALVGLLTVSNAPAGASYTYQVSDPQFEVVDSWLQLTSGASVQAAQSPITLEITATDENNHTLTQTFEITVLPNPHPWHQEELPEDADGDGDRDLQDAIFLIRQLRAGLGGVLEDVRPAPQDGGTFCDVVADNVFDVKDIIAIIRYLRANRPGSGEGEASSGATLSGSLSSMPARQALDLALLAWTQEDLRKKSVPAT